MAQSSALNEFNLGRGGFRFSPAACCQRERTSRAVSLQLRKKTRMTRKKERIIWEHEFILLTCRNVTSSGRRCEIANCCFNPSWVFVYRQGWDSRLTDVAGHVMKDLLA